VVAHEVEQIRVKAASRAARRRALGAEIASFRPIRDELCSGLKCFPFFPPRDPSLLASASSCVLHLDFLTLQFRYRVAAQASLPGRRGGDPQSDGLLGRAPECRGPLASSRIVRPSRPRAAGQAFGQVAHLHAELPANIVEQRGIEFSRVYTRQLGDVADLFVQLFDSPVLLVDDSLPLVSSHLCSKPPASWHGRGTSRPTVFPPRMGL
jgi:hypothetical protein